MIDNTQHNVLAIEFAYYAIIIAMTTEENLIAYQDFILCIVCIAITVLGCPGTIFSSLNLKMPWML